MTLRVFLWGVVVFGGCAGVPPAVIDPNLKDVDTLNECNEMKNECVGNQNGKIPITAKPVHYGAFHEISLAGTSIAHRGTFALSDLPPTGSGFVPYLPMMYPYMYPYGMYPAGYPYGMYPMMGGMPMMYGPW